MRIREFYEDARKVFYDQEGENRMDAIFTLKDTADCSDFEFIVDKYNEEFGF